MSTAAEWITGVKSLEGAPVDFVLPTRGGHAQIMMFPRRSWAFSAFVLPRKTRWVYVWLFAVNCIHFARRAGGSLPVRLRSHISGLLSRTRPAFHLLDDTDSLVHTEEPHESDDNAGETHVTKEGTALPSLPGSEGTAEKKHRDLSREEQTQCAAMQARIMSLGSWLSRRGTLYPAGNEHADSPCAESVVPGLHAVSHFFQFLRLTKSDYALQRALFPKGEPATMVSALTSHRANYRCKENVYVSTVEDDRGNSFSLRLRRRKYPVTPAVVSKTLTKLEGYLLMHTVFDAPTPQAVECDYRMLALKDILVLEDPTHSQGCIMSPSGYLLNYFLLFSPMKANLLSLVTAIEEQKDASADSEYMARMARMNLTMQAITLIARVRSKHVVLPRLRLHHFRLSDSGTVYFLPLKSPRKQSTAEAPKDAKGDASRDGATDTFDPRTNAVDAAVVLLYIWCPAEAKASSVTIESATKRKVLMAILYPHCPDMPELVRQIIISFLDGSDNISKAMQSPFYQSAEEILKNMVENT